MSVRVPKCRLHKATGQAFVELGGHRFYLGKAGTPASEEKYRRMVAEWLRSRAVPSIDGKAAQSAESTGLSINEMLLRFWPYAEAYYSVDGKPSKEIAGLRDALKPLRNLFGLTKANEFGPKSLKILQQHLIDAGLCRTLINQRVSRIKRVFKWAVAEEIVEPSVYHGLQAVSGLRFGRSAARETEPVKPVPDLHVALVLSFVSPQVRAMILLQRLTGMRPGEVVIMRSSEIDTSGEVWLYRPHQHKNMWRGHRREVPLGPLAQVLLKPFLQQGDDRFLFSPRDAESWRYENRPPYAERERKTPIYPSELRRRERVKTTARAQAAKRPKRDRYDVDSYRRAITYGITRAKKAGIIISHWHPHQLRHSRATEIRRSHGIEAAQVSLGQRGEVIHVYAERDMEVAVRIARQSG